METAMNPDADSEYMRLLGSTSTHKKANSARENGRKGGRPPKWSEEVRALAARWIRANVEAGCVPEGRWRSSLEWQLTCLARTLEEGDFR